MRFEDRLNELISEAEVPDELLPENIALMLKAKSTQSKMEAEHKNIKSAPNIAAQRRTIIMRTVASAAACAVFAGGMWLYNEQRDSQHLEDQISYKAVSPDSYDDLFNKYTAIYMNGDDTNGSDNSERTIGEENAETAPVSEGTPPIEYSETTPAETLPDISSYDFTDYNGKSVSEADIVKTYGEYMYCLKGSTLYIVSLETMEVVSEIESELNPPVEIYIENGKLIMVSKETEEIVIVDGETISAVTEPKENGNSPTASDVPANDADTLQPDTDSSEPSEGSVSNDETGTAPVTAGESAIPAGNSASRTNTIVDIYDVSDPTSPVHTTAYKQNGSYISSRISDGTLYMVSAYSDYRVKPLDTQTDLDSFVPAYYLDGEKKYLAAEDIIIPANANSTDYTVVSAINIGTGSAAVKAVLGSSKNVYCSADALYVVGVGKKDKEYSIISAFDLSDGGITYRASGSVEGAVLGQQSMNEYGGMFRIASKITGEAGETSVSVYVLDKSLTVVNSAGQLLPGKNVSSVRFEENYARLFEGSSSEASIVLDISTTPPTLAQSITASSAYLYSYSEGMLMGVGEAKDGSGLTLTMYSSENGLMLNTVTFAEEGVCSKALTDRRALLIDRESGIIGVPAYTHTEFGTKNSYYVFTYDDAAGFVSKGTIEYVDIDDSMIFERGEVKDDTLYVIGKGRIISARISDLKVIGSYEY